MLNVPSERALPSGRSSSRSRRGPRAGHPHRRTTVQGSTVVLTCVCREGGQDRPITRGEEQAARRMPDRRRKTRKERRRAN
jgi:hypothetical protein